MFSKEVYKSSVVKSKWIKEYKTKHGTQHHHHVFLEIKGKMEWAVYHSKYKDQSFFKEGNMAEFHIEEDSWNGKDFWRIKPVYKSKRSAHSYSNQKAIYGKAHKNRTEQSKYVAFYSSYVKDLIVAGIIKQENWAKEVRSMVKFAVELDKEFKLN